MISKFCISIILHNTTAPLSILNPSRSLVPVWCSWSVREEVSCLLISLLTLTCFHVKPYWTQTSELSSFAAPTTRRPLIWWLSHWCIDGTEPVSLPASLSPSLQFRDCMESHNCPSGKTFSCPLTLSIRCRGHRSRNRPTSIPYRPIRAMMQLQTRLDENKKCWLKATMQ